MKRTPAPLSSDAASAASSTLTQGREESLKPDEPLEPDLPRDDETVALSSPVSVRLVPTSLYNPIWRAMMSR
jgi:hypothetical protein